MANNLPTFSASPPPSVIAVDNSKTVSTATSLASAISSIWSANFKAFNPAAPNAVPITPALTANFFTCSCALPKLALNWAVSSPKTTPKREINAIV